MIYKPFNELIIRLIATFKDRLHQIIYSKDRLIGFEIDCSILEKGKIKLTSIYNEHVIFYNFKTKLFIIPS